jgi:hypothetical protein
MKSTVDYLRTVHFWIKEVKKCEIYIYIPEYQKHFDASLRSHFQYDKHSFTSLCVTMAWVESPNPLLSINFVSWFHLAAVIRHLFQGFYNTENKPWDNISQIPTLTGKVFTMYSYEYSINGHTVIVYLHLLQPFYNDTFRIICIVRADARHFPIFKKCSKDKPVIEIE